MTNRQLATEIALGFYNDSIACLLAEPSVRLTRAQRAALQLCLDQGRAALAPAPAPNQAEPAPAEPAEPMPEGLELEIDDSTQSATLYRDGKPIATLQRRRVYASGPVWRAYDLQGRLVRSFWHTGSAGRLARLTVAKLDRRP